jgi:hypothetical protein
MSPPRHSNRATVGWTAEEMYPSGYAAVWPAEPSREPHPASPRPQSTASLCNADRTAISKVSGVRLLQKRSRWIQNTVMRDRVVRIAGHVEDTRVCVLTPNMLGQGSPAAAWHDDIGEQQVNGTAILARQLARHGTGRTHPCWAS